MDLAERLQKIKNTWLSIKEKDPQFLAPGAMFHHYHIDEENATRQSIEFFENNNGFKLPEEYKEYLINVTNGGVGPFNVMFPLHDSLYPLNRGKKGEDNYNDWLEGNLDHFVSEFPVTEDDIINYLKYKINHATVETPPIIMERDAPGYLFLCTAEPGKHYILPVNGACLNEVWILKEAFRLNDTGEQELYFNISPEIRFVDDQINTMSFLEWIEDAQKNWFNSNNSLDSRLAAVKTTWFNLAAHDREEKIFGAFMHHYKMNDTLSEEKISAFEKTYNFEIPAEYRQYLKSVSDGGVGPFYGMYSLQNSLIALNSGSNDEGNFINYIENNPIHFCKPFPITDEQINNYLLKKIKDPSAASEPIKMDVNAGGYLFLAEYGCGGYYIMPINGNGAGEVWYLQKMSANKLSYEITDANGNITKSGKYGYDADDSYFELYPELKWNNVEASTINFLEWIEYKQSQWFVSEINAEDTEEDEVKENIGGLVSINNEQAYYPLAVGNTWTMDYGGQQMVTVIEEFSNGEFTTSNSLNPIPAKMKKANGEYLSDSMEKGNMQVILKDNLKVGDSWEVNFKANTLDCIYVYTVKELLPIKNVGGIDYKDVVMIELDSLYVINGTRMSTNAFTQNYYAKGVGAILVTTSGVLGNNVYPLLSYKLN